MFPKVIYSYNGLWQWKTTVHPGLPVHGQYFSKYCSMDASVYEAKVRMKQIKADKGNTKEEGFCGQIRLNKIRQGSLLSNLFIYIFKTYLAT